MRPYRPFRIWSAARRAALLVAPVAILVAAALRPLAAQPAVSPASSSAAKPTLVVLITVDQLVPGYLDQWKDQFTGGFKRLLTQGAFFTQAFHDHAATETAPGHATLWSGRTPAQTGIVLNDLGVPDPQAPLLQGRGGGASPYRFRGSTFFDGVRAADPLSRGLSVSRKDRGAILPMGRAKQQVFWYGLDGRFTTSTYYADTLPTWVQAFNARNPIAPYLGQAWTLLLPESAYPERDDEPTENGGKEHLFPHVLPADPRRAGTAFAEFPWMDDITVDLALAGVGAMQLGANPNTTDVLAVSLSTTDAVGHKWGPRSRELHDQVLRVDRALGRLLDSLYVLRDSTRIVVALGADHGVAPQPELSFPGTDPNRGRVIWRPVIDSARSRLASRGVEGDALELNSGIITVDRARLAAKGVPADSVIRALQRQLLALPGMLRVDRVEQLAAKAAAGDKLARRWANALPADMDAALTVTYRPYYYGSTALTATHGTPHDYDAHIPVLFLGAGVRPGRYGATIASVDVAPTLAVLTGVRPFEARLPGRVLREALRDGARAGTGRGGAAPRR